MQLPGKKTYTLISARSVFIISLIVIVLTITAVYFWRLGSHHTFFEGSLVSTTILSLAFFLFISISLYKGVKLKDDVGRITDNIKPINLPSMSDVSWSGDMAIGLGEGCGEAVVSFIVWIIVAILLAILLYFFGQALWIILLLFTAMLYWIFFRALRLVFKNSNRSKGNLFESVRLGLFYTILYNFWIYGILLLTEFFHNWN